jgi:hypothetical protein
MKQQDELARRIVALLDEGVENIAPERRQQLSKAREQALARQRAEPARAWVPAWAGQFSRFTEHRVFGVRYLIPMAALVLGVAGVVYMQGMATSNEVTDIELGLLTDELPINAYLDKGFDSWLKRSLR